MPVLNAQPVLDKYDPSCTIQDIFPVPNGGGWYVLAQNGNSAFAQVQYGPEYGETGWSEEQVLGSGAYGTIPTNASGIRFRNAVAGKAQVVTVFLAPKNVPALGVQNLGTVNVVTGSTLNFQHNDLAVASEPTGDFEDSATLVWALTDDIPNTRVKVAATVQHNTGDYTAAQVTNAADKASAATQVFTGDLSNGMTDVGGGSTVGPGWYLNSTTGHLNLSSTGFAIKALGIGAHVVSGQDRVVINGDGSLNWGNGSGTVNVTMTMRDVGLLDVSGGTNQGNMVFRGTQGSQGGGTTYTPDYTKQWNRINVSNVGTMTIAAPTRNGVATNPGANDSIFFFLVIHNGSGGSLTSLTFNAIYSPSQGVGTPANGAGFTYLIAWNGATTKWEIITGPNVE